MLRRLILRLAGPLIRALPPVVRRQGRRVLTMARYRWNTSRVAPDPDWREWTSRHGRRVSIVIPSYNDFELLSKCLRSIAKTASHLDYEVVVVDDYAQAENAARLKTLEGDRVRVILKDSREGFAVAVNTGMRAVPSDRDIVILNSDIVALPGWLDALMGSAYAIDPAIGMVSARLIYPDGRIQYGGTYYARLLAPQWFGHLYVGRSANDPSTAVPWYNRSISGACTYITRAAYERVGGLNEGYWLGFEDVDYGLNAWEHGIRCYYQPAATLVHHESASRGYSQGPRELASMRLFWRRWERQFLRRELGEEGVGVDFVISPRADQLWRRYVDELADRVSRQGIATRVWHAAEGSGVDERLVTELEGRMTIKVCCDYGAQQTVWLGSLLQGKPMYLAPGVESIAFADDRRAQSRIVAGYRPEFDYVVPDRFTAQLITAESAWEVQHRVVPVLKPAADPELPISGEGPVVAIGADQEQAHAVAELARAHNREFIRLSDPHESLEALEVLTGMAAAVVVSFVEGGNSVLPLLCMSRGAAYLGWTTPRTRYEVLDGYNALTFTTLDEAKRALADVLDDDAICEGLRENGRRTADWLYRRSSDDIVSVFRHVARTAV